uniref:Embryonic polarity protein dorsal n=1 Tax=Culex pipiens TaxID=7175 RepID=A0A8D8IJI5_CULPI
MATPSQKPYVVITEQPQSKGLRFRYECEGRSAGSIPGVRSTTEHKTHPTIELRGYKGRAVVVVSCVTKDPPYRAHPHNLVGKDGCKEGVCTVVLNSATMSYTFNNLGIQCVKKKDIEGALKTREKLRVDPYKTGFGHVKQLATIDLNAVRLCFQVFIEGQQPGRFSEPLQPVVSDVIYDKKAMSELVICKLSHVTAPTAGGKEIIILCEKVTKEDISVRFYEERDGRIVWEDVGEFQHNNVHKQVAICFRTPRYHTLETSQPVMVNIQLRRPSDGATSEPLPFELLPLDATGLSQKRKRPKFNSSEVLEQTHGGAPPAGSYGQMLPTVGEHVKLEPREQLFGFQGPYRNPNESPEHSPGIPNAAPLPYPDPNFPGPASTQPNDFFQQYPPNHYNYPPKPTQQYPNQQQFQPNFPMTQQPAPSTSTAPQPTCQQMALAAGVQPQEYNLSSLLDMDIGRDFAMNSSEIKSIMGHFSTAATVAVPTEQQQQQYQQQVQAVQQQMVHRMHQDEEENLSNSFTRLTTNPMNDLNKLS